MRAGAVRNGRPVDGENLSRNQRSVMLFRMARHNVPFAEIESLDHRNGDDDALRLAVASVQREQTGNSVEGFELTAVYFLFVIRGLLGRKFGRADVENIRLRPASRREDSSCSPSSAGREAR